MRLTDIVHSSHPHRLHWGPIEAYICDGCKEPGFSRCYQCPCQDCNFHLHEECGNAPPSTTLPFLKDYKFKFHQNLQGRFCDACGMEIKGFLYQCSHKSLSEAYDLHPCCAKLPKSLSENGVKIYLRKEAPSTCLRCNSEKFSESVNGWSYVSSCGKYCYHVGCVREGTLEDWRRGSGKPDSGQPDVTNGSSLLILFAFFGLLFFLYWTKIC